MKHIFYFIFILLLFIPTAFAGENDPWEFGNTTHTTCYIGGGQGLVDCIGYVNASYFYGDGSHLTGVVINQYNLTKADIINFGFFNDINNFTGTLTNNNFCTYDSTNNIINCSTTNVDTYNTTAQMRAAVVTGISGENITTGTVADARIASTIARDSELPGVNTTAEIQVSIWDTITDAKWCKYTSATDRIDCNVEPVVDTNTYNTSVQMRLAAPTYNLTDANIGAMGYTKDTDTNTYNTTAQMQISIWDTITNAKWCKYTSATDRIDCNVEPVVDTNTFNTSAEMRTAAPTYNLTDANIGTMGYTKDTDTNTYNTTAEMRTAAPTYNLTDANIGDMGYTKDINTYNTSQEMQDAVTQYNLSKSNIVDMGFYFDITNFTGTLTNTKWCVYDSGNNEINCNVEPITDTNTFNTSAEMRTAAPTYNLTEADITTFGFTKDTNTFNTSAEMRTAAPTYNLTEANVDTYVDNNGYLTSVTQYNLTEADIVGMGFYESLTNFTGTLTDGLICVYDDTNKVINCTESGVVDTYNTTAEMRAAAPTYNLTEADITTFGFTKDTDTNTFNTTAQMQISVWDTITDAKWCVYDSASDRINCNIEPVSDTNTFNTSAEMRAAAPTYNLTDTNIGDMGYTKDTDTNTYNTSAEMRLAAPTYNLTQPNIATMGFFNNIANVTGTLTDTKYCIYDSGSTSIVCDSEGGTDGYNTSAEMRTAAPTYNLTEANIVTMGFTKDTDTNTYNTTAEMRTAAPTYNLTEADITTFGFTKDTDTNTYNTTAQMQISIWDTITNAKWCKYTSATDRIDCDVEPVVDTTYSDGNGISESNEVFSVAGNTALTQDADGLSVTAGGIGDTQIADAYINQALTTTSDVTFNKIIVTTNITTLKCMVFNNGAIIGEPGCV